MCANCGGVEKRIFIARKTSSACPLNKRGCESSTKGWFSSLSRETGGSVRISPRKREGARNRGRRRIGCEGVRRLGRAEGKPPFRRKAGWGWREDRGEEDRYHLIRGEGERRMGGDSGCEHGDAGGAGEGEAGVV